MIVGKRRVIDPNTVVRIHWSICRLEDRQRHECAEGDSLALRPIAARYDRIDQGIENESHGGWRRGW